MTAKQFRFETGGLSHTGRVRDHNEDRFLAEPDAGIWVVADGMGGHHGGELASGAIVSHLTSIGRAASAPDLQARFVDRITRANDEIQQLSRANGATIGSTVVALLAFEQHFAVVWSGDSRLYMIRDGELMMISRDHTEANELLDRGSISEEEAANWPRKNVITRAIGVSADPNLDQRYGSLKDRDTFILCSDGLTGHVEDHEIFECVHGEKPQAAVDRLVEMTLERGATDNVTVVVVRCFDKSVTTPYDDPFALPDEGH
jgi:protein phosphatase